MSGLGQKAKDYDRFEKGKFAIDDFKKARISGTARMAPLELNDVSVASAAADPAVAAVVRLSTPLAVASIPSDAPLAAAVATWPGRALSLPVVVM